MYQGKIESAIDAFKRTLSIDPTLPEAYNKLGIICYKQGNAGLAFACWKQALMINPDFEEARRNIGLIQNAFQFDVEDEIPAYQHVTAGDAEGDENASVEDGDDLPTWRNKIRRWGAFRKG